MADTTSDVNHKDQMGVICRYVNESGVPCERLIHLKDVRDKTGAGQAAAILLSIDNNGLDSGRVDFESYDFTNSMVG